MGIERHVVIDSAGDVVRCTVEESHEEQLTRDDVTAAVHFIGFEFTPEQVERWGSGPVVLSIDHPEYSHSTTLSDAMVAELATDLRGD